ncbi:MAG: hypothetical protein WB797_15165, partial [Nocardioides sp.]
AGPRRCHAPTRQPSARVLIRPGDDPGWRAGSVVECRSSVRPVRHLGPGGLRRHGVTETLVHGHDASLGLGVAWEPPADLCLRVLARLFPVDLPDADPWTALLWATGRADLPGRPRLDDWRWYAEPRSLRTPSTDVPGTR